MKKKPVIAILANYPTWLLCDQIPSRIGHYGVWHVAMHEAFAGTEEFEFHRIVLDSEVKERIDFEDKGTFFHVLPRTNRKIGLFTAYASDRIRVHRLLKQIKPDLVHIWGTEFSYGLCGMDFKGKRLFSLQGILTAIGERTSISRFERIHSLLYEKCVLRAMPAITTESEWARDRVLELAPLAQIRLWDYAVEERFFDSSRGLESSPACLMGASNHPGKNHKLAIAAFSRPELRHVKLYLAGEKPANYEKLPSNIIALGRVSRDKMVELLSKVWCVIHPSLADTGPTIIKEARVVGVPCIATHDCGAKRYIVQGKSGFVINSRSEQQLVDAVLTITKDAATSLCMGEYDWQRCRLALTGSTMVENIRTIYKNMLSGNDCNN
ncbi:MAG: glycosyltransferase [Akkermansia sp.]|nr:glycosyltransferase [Akkermansia sp.]